MSRITHFVGDGCDPPHPPQLQPGWWMTAHGWLDEDGEHVWSAHDCVDRRVVTMMPHPNWRVENNQIEPSFSCDLCGVHTKLSWGIPPESHR